MIDKIYKILKIIGLILLFAGCVIIALLVPGFKIPDIRQQIKEAQAAGRKAADDETKKLDSMSSSDIVNSDPVIKSKLDKIKADALRGYDDRHSST